ncbi:MAG: OmpA family protein [Alphaproteobacteria bacterium]|nr:OmpA family protein [Alphaproteobacteria bacterium]
MRAQARRITHEEEEESAFVSMTDMTVGFLFIMMILLAFFTSSTSDEETVPLKDYETVMEERDDWQKKADSRAERISHLEAEVEALKEQKKLLTTEFYRFVQLLSDARLKIKKREQEIAGLQSKLERLRERLRKIDPLEEYLSRVADVRREVLERLRDAIWRDFPDLQVELSEQSDALRFQGEGLFATNSYFLTPQKSDIIAKLAQRLYEVLPCFTLGGRSEFSEDCNPEFVMIEAVQIEGHTDSVGSDTLNRELSADRANSTFFAMTDAAPLVMDQLNLKLQPVLSVAAYGPDRPVTTNETPAGRATNRRIDLRFIMVTPQNTDGIARIRKALETVWGENE